jgi:predicted acyltransferase (DUF342 family)
MLIFLIFIFFIILFLLPFLPGIIELIRKEDAKPLFVSMDYIRNPRYFGKSFTRMIHRATAGFTFSPGIRDIQLSKSERVELTNSIDIPANKELNHMLYVIGKLASGDHVQFNKEVYATDDVSIGPDNMIQALAGDMKVTIAEGVKFNRWLDAEGDIEIGAKCNLGISVSSGSMLFLSSNCIFRRLYGMPIATGHSGLTAMDLPEPTSPPYKMLPNGLSFIRRHDSSISAGTIIYDDVVFPQDVRIGQGATFKGHIKSYGKIVIEDDVIIEGNVFADGDIIIGRNARIGGHVFSQMSITISGRTIISRPERIKSVIGKKSISIERDVTIYGYVATEGNGRTL